MQPVIVDGSQTAELYRGGRLNSIMLAWWLVQAILRKLYNFISISGKDELSADKVVCLLLYEIGTREY